MKDRVGVMGIAHQFEQPLDSLQARPDTVSDPPIEECNGGLIVPGVVGAHWCLAQFLELGAHLLDAGG